MSGRHIIIMNKFVPLFFVLFLSSCISTSLDDIIASTPIIEGRGSGVVVRIMPHNEKYDTAIVLTASHVIVYDMTTMVFNISLFKGTAIDQPFLFVGWIIAKDPNSDIALIAVPVPKGSLKAITCRPDKAPMGTKLKKIGHMYMNIIYSEGSLGGWGEKFSLYTGIVGAGDSGCGVYDEQNRLVGIVHGYFAMGRASPVGMFVPINDKIIDKYMNSYKGM